MSYRDVIYIYIYMTVCRDDCGYTYLVHPCKMESRVGVQCWPSIFNSLRKRPF